MASMMFESRAQEEQVVAERWRHSVRARSRVVVGERAVMSRSRGRDGWPRADGEQHVETRRSRWVAAR